MAYSNAESPQTERIREARAALLLTHPFFGVLSLKLKLLESTSLPTAGVTTKELLFNPAFIDTLGSAELKGLIAHEVMHLAMLHPMRECGRDHGRWNEAADYAINENLVKDGFTLPPGGLLDKQYANLQAEVIYDRLPVRPPNSGGGNGAGDGATGHFSDAGADGSAEHGEALREWQQNVHDATRAAQSAGKLPAGIKRLVEDSLHRPADWRALLRRFMTDQIKAVPTWSKRNKRFPGVYLPGVRREGMGEVAFIIDTSGSIDSATLARFSAECNAIVADCAPARVHVIYADAAVNRVDEYESGEPITFDACGGGGTDFRPAFEHIESEGWPLACAVYLTDMCGTFPENEPAYPVLWAAYGAGGIVAPVGETVVIG